MSREAFEKWAADKTFLIKAGDDYFSVKQMAWEAWQAALESQTAQPQVPEGYVLVPIEPTENMQFASYQGPRGPTWPERKAIYKAMIAASQEQEKS